MKFLFVLIFNYSLKIYLLHIIFIIYLHILSYMKKINKLSSSYLPYTSHSNSPGVLSPPLLPNHMSKGKSNYLCLLSSSIVETKVHFSCNVNNVII